MEFFFNKIQTSHSHWYNGKIQKCPKETNSHKEWNKQKKQEANTRKWKSPNLNNYNWENNEIYMKWKNVNIQTPKGLKEWKKEEEKEEKNNIELAQQEQFELKKRKSILGRNS